MTVFSEENIASLAAGIAENLVELGSANGSTLNVFARSSAFSVSFGVGIAIQQTVNADGDGFDYVFSIGGSVIASGTGIALASALQPVIAAGLSSATFAAALPLSTAVIGGVALIGAGVVSGIAVDFAVDVLGDAFDVVVDDLLVPDTTITIRSPGGETLTQLVINGDITTTGFVDESAFIRGLISIVSPETASELLNGGEIEFSSVFSETQVFSFQDGEVLEDLALGLSTSVERLLEVNDSAIDPLTGRETDGAFSNVDGQPPNINLFTTSGDQSFVFTRPGDILSLDTDRNILTADIQFSPENFINGEGNIVGNSANNIITGDNPNNDPNNFSDGADIISGGAGDDVLVGLGGDDILEGGAGRDALIGGSGADTFISSADSGLDFVDDYIFSEGDTLEFSAVSSIDDISFGLVGGGGDSIIVSDTNGTGFEVDGRLFESGPTINFRIGLDSGIFEISLNRGDLSIESIRVEGTDGADVLDGTPGNDELIGNGGVDIISGGEGNDDLDGGTESDTLTGGIGRDDFIFRTGDGADTIVDYSFGDAEAGNDILELLDIEGIADLTSTRVAADGTTDAEGPSLLLGYGDAGDNIFLTDFFTRQTTDIRFIQVRFNGGEKDTRGEADLPELILVPIGADGAILADPEDAVMDITDPDPNGNEILGTESNDSLDGTGADETIRGLGGIDIINAVNAVNAVNDNDVTGVTLTLARGVA